VFSLFVDGFWLMAYGCFNRGLKLGPFVKQPQAIDIGHKPNEVAKIVKKSFLFLLRVTFFYFSGRKNERNCV
jgi:hypothetical protein